MWDIIYDRLTNYHGMHNLIWIWSTPEADWYPGNSKTDIMGFDSYPGEFNYTMQKTVFDNLYAITTGNKLITMSENGPIPDIDNALNLGAPWSYFMSWSDLAFSQNTNQHILDVYNNPKVITLENIEILAVAVIKFNVIAEAGRSRIEWTTSSEKDNARFEIERSSDGIHFSGILTVKGQGNSSSSHHYQAYDEHPLSVVNYYRLIQYNTDGKRTGHGIKILQFGQLFKATALVYPNPLTGQSGILLNNYNGSKMEVAIRDMSGKLLFRHSYSTIPGQSFNRLYNLARLPAGPYLVQVKGYEMSEMLKDIMTGNL
jgi:hypothetical protein